MVLHDLAASCGIEVPEARLEQLGKNEVFLVRRFDREGETRIHFASAMTMTGKKMGAGFFPRYSRMDQFPWLPAGERPAGTLEADGLQHHHQ